MTRAVLDLVASFAATTAIECGLAVLLFRSKQLAYAVFLANLLVNPLMQVMVRAYYSFVGPNGYWTLVVGLEVLFLFVEAAVIKVVMDYRYRAALLRALPLNAVSFAVAVLVSTVAT